ncbi:MAG: hypothetical protein ABI383_03135 [Acidobacteriaceae bacterium]
MMHSQLEAKIAPPRPIAVAKRFCGPPTTGNGGYTCGLLAQFLSDAAAVECTIRKPIPLERALQVEISDHRAKLLDGTAAVIEAAAVDYSFALPRVVTFPEAQAAVKASPAYQDHPFPTCFVCGPERAEHDGLRVFPGPVEAQDGFTNLYAASWVPAREFADDDENGTVRPEFIWAAMDCPTGFAAGFPYEGKLVTGRLAVKLLADLHQGEECVLMSWSLGNEGRKCHAAAALFNGRGVACAIARATWIKLT